MTDLKRLSSREFRATFARLTEPVYVGDGVWFPTVSLAQRWAAESVLAAGVPAPSPRQMAAEEKTQASRDEYARKQEARDRVLRRMLSPRRGVIPEPGDGRRHPER